MAWGGDIAVVTNAYYRDGRIVVVLLLMLQHYSHVVRDTLLLLHYFQY